MTPKGKIEHFNNLLSKYLDNRATPEEIEFIEKYYQQFENDQDDPLPVEEIEQSQARVLENLKEKFSQENKKPASIRIRWIGWAAAIIIVVLSGATFLFLNHSRNKPVSSDVAKQATINNISPGGNKAIITLQDGSKIFLDQSSNGVIAQQGNTRVVKLTSGEIAYKNDAHSDKPYINTITTPRGGKYQLTLADGTKFWMNSESSITYPTFFEGTERRVKITGEVYFEVSKNQRQPFYVDMKDGSEIRVLGTHFNVNTNTDNETIAATLLEGSILISNNQRTQLLKPGQQAVVINNQIQIKNGVDTSQVVAWKNGYFSFNNTSLEMVMKQLARWYDVNIIYEGKKPEKKFWGGISMNSSLSQVLQVLEESKVKFRVEDKNIIVLNK